MEQNKDKPGFQINRYLFKKILIASDDFFHVVVAFFLLVAAGSILFQTIFLFSDFSVISMIKVVNNCLLVLIVTELLWTIIRYLGKEAFSLNPFLFIGIIAGIRQILVLEAERSLGEIELSTMYLMELGLITLMIFTLVGAYFISSKAAK